jgi:hypothetical protein
MSLPLVPVARDVDRIARPRLQPGVVSLECVVDELAAGACVGFEFDLVRGLDVENLARVVFETASGVGFQPTRTVGLPVAVERSDRFGAQLAVVWRQLVAPAGGRTGCTSLETLPPAAVEDAGVGRPVYRLPVVFGAVVSESSGERPLNVLASPRSRVVGRHRSGLDASHAS